MKLVCIGSGYVGSVTGTAFATLGHHVTLVDINPAKVEEINDGSPPVYEPGLKRLLQACVGTTLFASAAYRAVAEADVVMIAVGTPAKEDGTADLHYVEEAARSIAVHLNRDRYTVVVNKSTVPVGTADRVAAIIGETSGLVRGVHFEMVSNPEFLREGFALRDVFFPDRIVIGTDQERAQAIMKRLYANMVQRRGYDRIADLLDNMPDSACESPRYFETDTRSSEMIKYASNAFLAVKISYINEVARLSEAIGANVLDVARGMGMDTRIGGQFLQVSSGWSGSCFPKDAVEFLTTSLKYGSELKLVKAAIESNEHMHQYVVDKLERSSAGLAGKKVGVLGLTFKPDTDDARTTQASVVIRQLLQRGARVAAHDPKGMDMFRLLHPELAVDYCREAEHVAVQADALLLLTHWGEYAGLHWEWMHEQMESPYILDTRNYLDGRALAAVGFRYDGLGVGGMRPPLEADAGNVLENAV